MGIHDQYNFVSTLVEYAHPCEWCAAAWVVDDLLHNTANIAMSLSIIRDTELCWLLVETCVGREDGSTTFPLIANDTTHLCCSLMGSWILVWSSLVSARKCVEVRRSLGAGARTMPLNSNVSSTSKHLLLNSLSIFTRPEDSTTLRVSSHLFA